MGSNACAMSILVSARRREENEASSIETAAPSSTGLSPEASHEPFTKLCSVWRARDCRASDMSVRGQAEGAAGSASSKERPMMKSSLTALVSSGSVGSMCSCNTVPKAPAEQVSASLSAAHKSSYAVRAARRCRDLSFDCESSLAGLSMFSEANQSPISSCHESHDWRRISSSASSF